MSLFRSEDNLNNAALDFINKNDTITIFSAYIKTKQIQKLNKTKKVKQIIVRWEVRDLCVGASDIDLFDYCKENRIALYRNPRIHLKAIWNNSNSVFFGSANVTNKGIGEIQDYCNFELNGVIDNISFDDINYFNKLRQEAQYVDEVLFNRIRTEVENFKGQELQYPNIPLEKTVVDSFLISELPMTETPQMLYEIYSEGKHFSISEFLNASHDITLYKILNDLDKNNFFDHLKYEFNNHPFIKSFKETIKESNIGTDREGSMGFGQVRRWFAENTTTVPTPRAFELTSYVGILYEWICWFDEDFSWDVPGRKSQVIYYLK